jgi:hypothetical protein
MRAGQAEAGVLDVWAGGLSQNFLHVVGIEASLLAGMVLVGIVRLITQKRVQPALAVEGEPAANG